MSINKDDARNSKNKRVKYNGNGRPYLARDSADLRLTGAVSDFSASVQVSYKSPGLVTRQTDWVGTSALSFFNTEFDDAINSLRSKLENAKAEVTRLETAIKTLEEL